MQQGGHPIVGVAVGLGVGVSVKVEVGLGGTGEADGEGAKVAAGWLAGPAAGCGEDCIWLAGADAAGGAVLAWLAGVMSTLAAAAGEGVAKEAGYPAGPASGGVAAGEGKLLSWPEGRTAAGLGAAGLDATAAAGNSPPVTGTFVAGKVGNTGSRAGALVVIAVGVGMGRVGRAAGAGLPVKEASDGTGKTPQAIHSTRAVAIIGIHLTSMPYCWRVLVARGFPFPAAPGSIIATPVPCRDIGDGMLNSAFCQSQYVIGSSKLLSSHLYHRCFWADSTLLVNCILARQGMIYF